jgi:peroxiredoxin Q/BCP
MLKEGSKAPKFSLHNQKGELVSLANYKGKKLVIYFYPADNTPTCTTEACNLSDNYKALQKAGYTVLGVSPDNEKKHNNFIAKYNLPFDLLCDVETKMAQDYDVWGEKQMYGKKYFGILRTTFIIDEKGKIERIISDVKSKEHASQILNG